MLRQGGHVSNTTGAENVAFGCNALAGNQTGSFNAGFGYQAFWNNAALLMYLEGFLNTPSTLHVVAPQPWKIATAGTRAVPAGR